MSISKRYKGKKITPKDKNWSKGTWYLWKRLNGRIIHKALIGAQTKEQAERAAAKLIEKAFNQRYGIQDTTTTFRDFATGPYDRYVEQHNVNRVSKRQYIRLLTGRYGNVPIVSITPQDLRDAQSHYRKTYSASSVNLIMSTASKIFTLACQEGILDRNPMQYVTRLKEPPPRNRLLSKEEWERLWVELEKDELMFRLVVLATNLPLRRGQLLAISPDAIDWQNSLLSITASKGRDRRIIPLNHIALTTLKHMSQAGHLPFPLKDFRKRWRRALISAGINDRTGKRGDNFTFHDLRHELATQLSRNKVHTETIQKLFGHSGMKITQVYINPEMAEMAEAMKSLDGVSESEVIQ